MNFFTRYKKIFLAFGFLAIILIIGYFIWRLFFQATVVAPIITPDSTSTIGGLPTAGLGGVTGTGQTGTGGLPSTDGGTNITTGIPSSTEVGKVDPRAVGGITKTEVLNATPAVGSTINQGGQVQYYDSTDGKFYRVDSSGNKVSLSDKVFHSVSKVTWATDSNKAVLEYPDGSNVVYNFSTQKQVTLPAHWKDFSFSPNSDKLISKSMGVDPDSRYLVVSNDDGSEAIALEKIGTKDATVYPSWSPNNQIVAMYTEGVDLNRQEIYFVGLNGENFKSTVVEGRGLQYQWSTNGDKLLYSVYNTSDNLNPRLWIVDATSDTIGQNRSSFNIKTWASKCTFATDTEIYCAVPNELPEGAGLYPELADTTEDSLYKIDLTTGMQKLIAIPDGSYNISQVMVSTDQDYLFFTDKFSGSIYKVNL